MTENDPPEMPVGWALTAPVLVTIVTASGLKLASGWPLAVVAL